VFYAAEYTDDGHHGTGTVSVQPLLDSVVEIGERVAMPEDHIHRQAFQAHGAAFRAAAAQSFSHPAFGRGALDHRLVYTTMEVLDNGFSFLQSQFSRFSHRATTPAPSD